MLSPGELALFFKASASLTKAHLKSGVEDLLKDAVTISKAAIGHEIKTWEQLSQATLEGFWHAGGFRVKGKIELGFVGQVSATDPLLRTGEMRNSIDSKAEVTVEGADGVVGSPSKIALWQEMGTANARYPIPPRPFTSLGLLKSQSRAEKIFGAKAVEQLVPGIR